MPSDKEEFDRYFLNAQKEGGEVYLGNGAALIVYREDKSVGIQVMESLAGLPSVVYCGFDLLYTVSLEFERNLQAVIRPENRLGIQLHLTDMIKSAYRECALWHEGQECLHLSLLNDDGSEEESEF